MKLSRRTFIGLSGSALIAAYAMDWTSALAAPETEYLPLQPLTRIAVEDIMFSLDQTLVTDESKAIFASVSRETTGTPLLQMGVHPRATFRWRAAPGYEFIVPVGQSLNFDPTTPDTEWAIIAVGDDNRGPFSIHGKGGHFSEPVYMYANQRVPVMRPWELQEDVEDYDDE